jgi:uncharacterized membrane protein YkoI
MKRLLMALSAVLALVLVGATFALAGGGGLIWDDGHAVKPGSLDDGKQFLPQTTISLGRAVATAQKAEQGRLGQVDLEQVDGRIVYMVDVGSHEVRIDATDGSVVSIGPQE